MNNNSRSKFKLPIISVIAGILGVGIIIGAGFIISALPELTLLIAISGAILFVALLVGEILIVNLVYKRFEVQGPTGPVLGSIMYDKINSLEEPALICDTLGKILWYNSFSQSVSGQKSPILGTYVTSFIDVSLNDDEDSTVVLHERSYAIEKTKIKSGEQTYFLLVLRDITKIVELERYINENDPVVAYIIVDNLEELLQFEQEKYRRAAGRIEDLVRGWATSVNGIIKEYEKDKYLFVFKSMDLDKFMSEGFPILDRVREIRVGNGNLPVTVSIGVASVKDASFAEKERVAHTALDMALQRGGDQAVVKIEDNTEFFGGRTNAATKRTKVRARVVGLELMNYINKASNVIIMAHKYPDYDAFGASIGIARLAMYCNAKFNIVTNLKDANIVKCMKFFAHDDNYKGVFVDANRGLDLVRSDTLLIMVDVNNAQMFESSDIAKNVENIVIIDHHRKTAEFERAPLISYIESSASSASELVSEMLEQVLPPQSLRRNEANMLLAGISLDTKQFTKGTGTKTYAAAMFLRDNGGSYEEIQDLFKTSLRDYKQESHFGEKIEMYRGCMAIALNPFGSEQADRILAARVADNLLMVDGVAASFALVVIGNTVHISARSNGTINVQLILEGLNGGGRYDAAGAQITDENIGAVLLKLKHAIDNYIDPEV